jgi:hypothetical protein
VPGRLTNSAEILDFIRDNPTTGQRDLIRKFGVNHESASLAILIAHRGSVDEIEQVRRRSISISTMGRRLRAKGVSTDAEKVGRKARADERTHLYNRLTGAVDGILGLPSPADMAEIFRARARHFDPARFTEAKVYLEGLINEIG